MGLCACQHPAPWGAGEHPQKTGPVPHNMDAAPTRAGAVQDPALFPAGCLWGCLTLLRALQGARAVLTILDMAPRDCHITTLHVASRCSDGFAAAAPALGELPSCCSQTQALAGNQLTLPLHHAKEKGWRSWGNLEKDKPLPGPCLGPHPSVHCIPLPTWAAPVTACPGCPSWVSGLRCHWLPHTWWILAP